MSGEVVEQQLGSGHTLASGSDAARGEASLICFDGVWRHWGRGSRRWAVLRGVDLHVAAGSAVCVAGANGAGKTTLLRIAAAILSPDRGSVTIDGIRSDANWREYHRRIGFLSAGDRGLYNRFSVRGHLEFVTALALMPRREREPAVDEALVRFELTELASRRTERLSQGQRQRLRLALAFVHRPRVVLLDEPRNSLDADGLSVLANTVAYVVAEGGSVLWCAPTGEEQPVRFDRTYLITSGSVQEAA